MARRAMRRHLLPLLGGAFLTVAAIAVMVWSIPYATTARSLYLFEPESPTEIVSGSARQGAGLLGLDIVTLNGDRRVEWSGRVSRASSGHVRSTTS